MAVSLAHQLLSGIRPACLATAYYGHNLPATSPVLAKHGIILCSTSAYGLPRRVNTPDATPHRWPACRRA